MKRKGAYIILFILLLSLTNSASAVWIYPDADIIVEDFTLNTVTAQNFTYVEIGTTYTNLSWDGATYHNITYVTNVSSNLSFIQMDVDTGTLSFDVYCPSGWSITNPSMKVLNANDVVESTLTSFTITTINSTHKHYSTTYSPTGIATVDMGYFDVNISLTASNTTLIYTGYKISNNLFYTYDKAPVNHPPTNITTSRNIIELNGVCGLGNYTTDIRCDIYAPTGWVISSASMSPTTNNSKADTVASSYSSSTINSTHRHLIFTYNPSNSLNTIDMGDFDVNISISASNSTHVYTNYTTSADLFEVYNLSSVGNITSSYNSTHDSINMSWNSVIYNTTTFRPNAAGTATENTMFGDSANYLCIDESTPDEDSTYIYNDNHVVDKKDSYNIPDHTTETGIIEKVTVFIRYRDTTITAAGGCYPIIRTGGSYFYDAMFHSNIYATSSETWTTNPDTSVAWTWSNIDSLEIGAWVFPPMPPEAEETRVTQVYAVVEWYEYTEAIADEIDSFVVVRSNTSQPVCPTDGYEVQNNTDVYYNVSRTFTEAYFTVFTYNSTTRSYGTGVPMLWGGIQLQCFNESNPSQAINFDIEITNSDASKVYTASDVSNGQVISFDDIPYGDDTIFVISNSSYRQRIFYYNLVINHFYNYTFYLPPIATEGGEDGEGTLRTYTDVKSVITPSDDLTITLTHTLEEMIGVYVYNTSGTYPDWVSVPNDNYTISGNDVIINQSVLDDNTTMVKVDYWYMDYDNEVETQLYYIQVINEYDQPVKDATVNIKKYINTTDTYLPVSVLLTDGNGYVSLYLIPDEHYKIFVTKTGYDDEISDFFPAVLYYGIHYPKVVKIYLSEPGTETLWTNIDWDISPTLYDHNNSISFYFNITSSDNKLEWYKMIVHYYNNSTGKWDLLYYFNKTKSSGGGSITYTTPSTIGKYALYCSFKKEGYSSFHFGLPDCYIYHIWNISGGGGTDIDTIITNIAGASPVYVGDTIIAYTSLMAAAVITFFLFTFSPKFAGFSIIVMGIIIGALKEPLHIITDDTINALAVTTIVILGIIVVIYTRKKG